MKPDMRQLSQCKCFRKQISVQVRTIVIEDTVTMHGRQSYTLGNSIDQEAVFSNEMSRPLMSLRVPAER